MTEDKIKLLRQRLQRQKAFWNGETSIFPATELLDTLEAALKRHTELCESRAEMVTQRNAMDAKVKRLERAVFANCDRETAKKIFKEAER